MAPQSATTVSAPVSPSVLHQQPKITDDSVAFFNDDHGAIPDSTKRFSLSRQREQREESIDESSLDSSSSDNNLIDLNSEKSLQSSLKETGTADVPSDMMGYQSSKSSHSESFIKTKDDVVDERGNPAACIFVASLTKGKNDEELNVSVSKHFEQWGELLNVKVLKDWMGRPYAFVQFESIQDAKMALQYAPGTILDGRSIRCEPARVNRTLSISPSKHDAPLVIKEIQTESAEFGKIEDITMLHGYPLPNGNVGDCAFVKYCYRDDAVKAFLSLSKMTQKWWVEWASNLDTAYSNISPATYTSGRVNNHYFHCGDRNSQQEQELLHGTTLYEQEHDIVFIGNLFYDVTEDELKERFNQYGTVHYLRIIRKSFPFKRVFAFIRFKEDSNAKEAIQKENGLEWHDKKLRVAYREPRDPNFVRFGHNRRMTMERPHPPGLGFPASDHQYIVSSSGKNSKNKSSASTFPATSFTANGRSTTTAVKQKRNTNSNASSTNTHIGSTPSSSSSDTQKNSDIAAMNSKTDCHEEKTAADDEQQHQNQHKNHQLEEQRKHQLKGNVRHQQQSQYPAADYSVSTTTMTPPFHMGMNGYMNPSDGFYHLHHHQQAHYMIPSTTPIYDPNMYPIMNAEDSPVILGSMQDAGTAAIEANNKNGLIYVPGFYDYSGVYYGPYYHSAPTSTATSNNGLPSPLSTSSVSSHSPMTNSTGGTSATMNSGIPGNGKTVSNSHRQPSSDMRSSSMNNNASVANNGSGYYYMVPPPPHHQTIYHQTPLGTNGPNNYMYSQYNTRVPGYNNATALPSINHGKKDENNKISKQSSRSNTGSSNNDRNKKIAISSPSTAGEYTNTTHHKN